MDLHLTLHAEFPMQLEQAWNDLLAESDAHVPFLRHDYQRTWWNTRGGGEWPQGARLAVITAQRGEALAGVAPLFWAPDEGGRGTLRLVGAVEVSDYLDLIACPQDLPAFTAALLDFLPGAGLPAWDALVLDNLLDTSPTLAAVRDAAGAAGWALEESTLSHSPYVPLPGDWEAYLASIDKKQRHEIRRKMRRAEAAPEGIDWYIVSERETLAAETEAFLELMANDPDKRAFLTEPMRAFEHEVIACAFDAGCLHLAFLTFGGQKAAAYLSFDYLNRLWVYNSGLNRDYMQYSPGWVLLGYLLQWANENGRSEFDFLRGDEDYKYRFGAVDRRVQRLTLTPPGSAA